MKHRDIISEINAENKRRLMLPLWTALLVAPVTLVFILLCWVMSPQIDAFATAHPNVMGVGCLIVGVTGWYFYGKRNWLW